MGKALLYLMGEALANTDWQFLLLGDEPSYPMVAPSDPRVTTCLFEVKGHRFGAWEQLGLPWVAKRERCDLLYCPSSVCPVWQPVPTVVTLHDTLMWTELPRSWYNDTVLPTAYRRSRLVATPSTNSRADIIRKWPQLASRVEVLPWGIEDSYLRPPFGSTSPRLAKLGVRQPYLLYFGGEVPRKRLDWAVRVWNAVEEASLQLVVCGLHQRDASPWLLSVPEQRRSSVLPLGFIDEDDMPILYSGARAVLYPTLYEGFGFPALEAQAAGTPILMSAVGSLSELAGPGAVVLPPGDLEAWVAACLGASSWPAELREEARAWAASFSWQASWTRAAGLFERAASSHS